jgi:hypothetical protein
MPRTICAWWATAVLAGCPYVSPGLHADHDADGVLRDDDCDDGDPDLGATSDDPDCDGAIRVVAVDPGPDRLYVDIDYTLSVAFSDPVDPETLDNAVVWADGPVDGAPPGPLAGGWSLSDDGRTASWTPDRGTLPEFETWHEIRLDGVANGAGNTVDGFRSRFQTVMVDVAYQYRLRNLQEGLALQTDGEETVGGAWTPIEPSSLWRFEAVDSTYHKMVSTPTNQALEGGDGTDPAFLTHVEPVFSGMAWLFVPVLENPSAGPWQSPSAYYLETQFQGPDRTLGYHSEERGVVRFGMKDQEDVVYADHVWVIENLGHL